MKTSSGHHKVKYAGIWEGYFDFTLGKLDKVCGIILNDCFKNVTNDTMSSRWSLQATVKHKNNSLTQ